MVSLCSYIKEDLPELSEWRSKFEHKYCLALMVCRQGDIWLQKRDNKEGIFYPDKISLFGGAREIHESPFECLYRELREEVGLDQLGDNVELIAHVQETDIKNGESEGYVFLVHISSESISEAREGTYSRVQANEITKIYHELTPIAAYACSWFLNKHNC